MFARNPIRYTGGITQRFSDIDFAGMDKDRCVAFIERFIGEKCEKLYYCQPDIDFPKGLTLICNDPDYYDFIEIAYECGVILPMYVDHFGDSNIHEWLDEHKDEFVGNVEEEVLDGAGLVKEVTPVYRDVGDSDTNDEVEMGEKAGAGEFFEEDMGDNEDVYPELPNIFNDKLNWKEQEPILGELLCAVGRDVNNGIFPISWAVVSVENKEIWKWFLETLSEDLQCWNDGNGLVLISDQHKGLIEAESVNVATGVGDDKVIVDATDALDRPRDEERMVGVNGRDEGVNVNARVKHVKPPKMRNKSERIIKLKLAKNVRGEGSSVTTTMDLD
ncbi:unnamed protein product [Lactuca saligna]|uniref:MULE transposase domain-containing protein n=1 Tax=Lactuca saligna TaxID=75948 RepID=A0AA35YWU9_LACSI|nr:unnamed protein product [Lactuca saligna]